MKKLLLLLVALGFTMVTAVPAEAKAHARHHKLGKAKRGHRVKAAKRNRNSYSKLKSRNVV